MATVSHELAPVHRPRRPRASPLYQLIERYYPDFERSYDERYKRRYGHWRPVIGANDLELAPDAEFLESERLERQRARPRELQMILDPEYL